MARNPLSDAKTQELIVEFVRESGQEQANFLDQDGTRITWACFDGICSGPTYYGFKKKHPDFAKAIDDAKTYYRQQNLPYEPEKRRELIEAVARECREGYVVTKVKTRKDMDNNVIETVEEVTKQPPREFLLRALLLDGFNKN